jgi:hypothetical protein
MQTHHKPSPARNNMRLIVIFCAVVFSVITLSLLFRLFFLIKESKVDKAKTFTVSFIYKNDLDIVTISSSEKKISYLKIRGQGSINDKKIASGVLPDAVFILTDPFSDSYQLSSYFYSSVFHGATSSSPLSPYDLLRLSVLAQSIPQSAVTQESMSLPVEENKIDTIVTRMLIDPSIVQDDRTISIVNATGVIGLGTKLGRVFSNMGLNVVSVVNGDALKDRSAITYFNTKSYTVNRLSSLLHLDPTENTKQGLSDIILTLGKDKKSLFN